jgi:hypothetical protein
MRFSRSIDPLDRRSNGGWKEQVMETSSADRLFRRIVEEMPEAVIEVTSVGV